VLVPTHSVTECVIWPLGAVLVELVKAHPELKFTALVRNPSHVETIRNLGIEVVQGSFSYIDLISSHARAADITINTADSDSTALNEAILTGQRARVVDDGKPPAVLLHTSGVAVFMDDGKEGKHDPNSKIWNVRLFVAVMTCVFGEFTCVRLYRTPMKRTFVLSHLRCCTVKSTHRRSFFLTVCVYCLRNCHRILQTSEKGHTESYIICPAAVVGRSRGPVPASSVFFKFLAQLAIAFKKTFYVGEGENLFYAVGILLPPLRV
jgi:hypothetical protein